MPKKIFDILPPKRFKRSPPSIWEKERLEREKKLTLTKNLFSQRFAFCQRLFGGRGFFKKALIFAPLFLILIGIFFHFALSKVGIEIWPEAKVLNFQEKVTIDTKINKVDFLAEVIPGKFFEDQKSGSEQFSASGKVFKEEKAQGIIRVYNAYSTLPQVLVATTRFISAEGKLFRSVERVTIPGGRYEKGKFVAGFLDIKVRAAEAGEDYNIGPSTFSIPGFAGTPRYTSFYGKSFSPMTGGFRGEVSQVTQQDLERAQNILVERLKRESKDSIVAKISSDFILLDEGISQEIIEGSSLAKAGTQVDSFNFQVQIKSKALGWKLSDLENFAKEFIRSNITDDKKIHQESLEINYWSESINMELGKIILNLAITAKIYSDIEEVSLKKALFGKSLKETQRFLEDSPKITKVSLKVFPFWLKKIPQKEEKIKIKLNLQ